jgi:uncharacterized protein (TIGR02757 family)
VYNYSRDDDREVVAFVASALAYGRVSQILRSVGEALSRMGDHPARTVRDATRRGMQSAMRGFVHRFTSGGELADVLCGLGAMRRRYGSLERAIAAGVAKGDRNIVPALSRFSAELGRLSHRPKTYLAVSPQRGSACKRLSLMLRWMVRGDAVDIGQWRSIDQALLIVPLDTHMHRIGRQLGAIANRQANMRAAADLTDAFARVCPNDPVKYDFALTHASMDSAPELAAMGCGPQHDGAS